MRGVADGAAGHAARPGLLDEPRHHVVAGHHAHAVVRVDHERGGRLFEHLDLRGGQQGPAADAVEVDGLKTVASMALDAAAVGLKQHVGADLGVFARHAVPHERVAHKVVHQLPGHIGARLGRLSMRCSHSDTSRDRAFIASSLIIARWRGEAYSFTRRNRAARVRRNMKNSRVLFLIDNHYQKRFSMSSCKTGCANGGDEDASD